MGWINVYSAGFEETAPSIFAFDEVYGRTFLFICISSVLAIIIMNIEGRMFSNFSLPYYLFWLVMLGLVLLIGKEINGAKAWIKLGSFGLQPAEFAKTATALLLAHYLSSSVKLADFQVKIKAFLIVALPLGLIILQPDVGTILVFIAFIFPLYREGLPGAFLLVVFGSVFLGVVSIYAIYTPIDYPFFGPSTGIPLAFIIILSIAIAVIFVIKNTVVPRFRPARWPCDARWLRTRTAHRFYLLYRRRRMGLFGICIGHHFIPHPYFSVGVFGRTAAFYLF